MADSKDKSDPGDPTLAESHMPTRELETRTQELTGHRPEQAAVPERIGRFRILGVLGQGGMGVVYRAEQEDPQRIVALKMIRGAGLEPRQIAMFRREIEVLARLEHPNIASIHEAGVTDDGQHFYSMELVQGQPLDEYLSSRDQALTRREIEFRLTLFRKVCDAVHFAHQRGVIHRDLKPSNILVVDHITPDRVPEVKVLDFGLARITDTDIGATMMTEVGVVKGTLPYMSPEQASGDPTRIDTRSDVYALGVILYEMLSGVRPVQFGSRSLVEAVRVICEDVPKPLSQVWPGEGRPERDLETIVHKALEKTPDRRYSGADGLSQDLERYQLSQPILAVPPSSVYLLKKFAQRNRVLVGGVVATVLALAIGVAAATTLAYREASQRRLAEAARDDLEAVVGFQSQLLSRVDPEQAGVSLLSDMRAQLTERSERGLLNAQEAQAAENALDRVARGMSPTDLARELLHKNVLHPAAQAMEAEFGSRPLIESRLRQTLGDSYRSLGLYSYGEEHLRRSVELREASMGSAHPSTLNALEALAQLAFDKRDYDETERLCRDYLGRSVEAPDTEPSVLRVRSLLARVLWSRDRASDAEPMLREILASQTKLLGPNHLNVLTSKDSLAVIEWSAGNLGESEALLAEVWEGRARHLGDKHPDTLSALGRYATVRWTQGDLHGAAASFGDALASERAALGDSHPRTLRTTSNLAAVYQELGRHEEAIQLHRGVLQLRETAMGEAHSKTLNSMNNLAVALTSGEHFEEAQSLLARLLELDRKSQPGSPAHALHLHTFAELGLVMEDWRGAETNLSEAIDIYERTSDRNLGMAYFQLATAQSRAGRTEVAVENLRRATQQGYRWRPDDEALEALRSHADLAAIASE